VAAAANHHLNDVQPPTMSHPTAGQRQLAVDDLLPLVGQGPAHLGQEIKVSDSIPLSLNMIPFCRFHAYITYGSNSFAYGSDSFAIVALTHFAGKGRSNQCQDKLAVCLDMRVLGVKGFVVIGFIHVSCH
jgi:hypothetical protein